MLTAFIALLAAGSHSPRIPAGDGVVCSYYDQLNFTQHNRTVEEDTVGDQYNGDFAGRWLGRYKVATTGNHQFSVDTYGYIILKLNGQELINTYRGLGDPIPTSSAVSLTADKSYSLYIEYVSDPLEEDPTRPVFSDKKPSESVYTEVPTTDLTTLLADLDADTDRDGSVEDGDEDDEDEDVISNSKGAIYNVNFDRDGTQMVGATPVSDSIHWYPIGTYNEDMTINGASDVDDITPIVVRDTPTVYASDYTVEITATLDDWKMIHLFSQRVNGETTIAGGPSEGDTGVDVKSYLTADAIRTLGIEGLCLKGMTLPLMVTAFDGVIELTVTVKGPSGGAGQYTQTDTIKLEVAPFMLSSNLDTLTNWFVTTAHPNNAVAGMAGGVSRLTYSENNQWFQDHVEIGYTNRPGQTPYCLTLKAPHPANSPWPESLLLGAGKGLFSLGGDLGGGAGDYGGNIELIPPTASRLGGTILLGDTASATMADFLDAQGVQTLYQPETEWLKVGHIDEVVQFIPGTGLTAVVADTAAAFTILDGLTVAQKQQELLFAKGVRVHGTLTIYSAGGANPFIRANNWGGSSNVFKYVRFVTGNAKGIVARVLNHNTNTLVLGTLWDTPSFIVPQPGNPALSVMDQMGGNVLTPMTSFPVGRTPAIGDIAVAAEDSCMWYSGGTPTPAMISVQEVLNDARFRDLNEDDIQPKIDGICTNLATQAGTSITLKKVPTLFVGERTSFTTGRSCIAFTPDMSNAQVLGSNVYMADTFGPRQNSFIAQPDRFSSSVIPSVISTGVAVDDWDIYHRLGGEVHCGTATRRAPYSSTWWTLRP